MSNTDKIATQTEQEKEALDQIKKPLSRKQVVAINQLRESIQNCERAGLPIYHGKKIITGATADKDGVVLS
ncbi:hypothetical protein VPSG_00035 [Vibrio phage pYD38-B]|uniref:hypothetical protein n=1 Tax=Vibrio phage pYD38-B TaxID=929835 RepID=UPI00034277BE|nr:hypothetical protein VPSG_00035 [Vibrio phage pYD38-B]AGN34354.1 hypothetical protein VPSG_00035 [Vibrio phage pYD38-B]